jgi:hypothetical protein
MYSTFSTVVDLKVGQGSFTLPPYVQLRFSSPLMLIFDILGPAIESTNYLKCNSQTVTGSQIEFKKLNLAPGRIGLVLK